MRIFPAIIAVLLVACTPGEPETYTTTANVDDASVPALLAAIDGLSDNDLPVAELTELSKSTKMDEEQQLRFPVSFKGEETDMLVHIWREQVDWVHVYASSSSQDLVSAVEAALQTFARPDE
jgi:hypothetical protein